MPPHRHAALGFLSQRVTHPVADPYPRDAGFVQRVPLFRELTDLPVPGIANAADSLLAAPKRTQGNRNDGMARELLALLVTHSDPSNREVEAVNAKARALERFQRP